MKNRSKNAVLGIIVSAVLASCGGSGSTGGGGGAGNSTNNADSSSSASSGTFGISTTKMNTYSLQSSNTPINLLLAPPSSLQFATTDTYKISSSSGLEDPKITAMNSMVHPTTPLKYSTPTSALDPVAPFALILNAGTAGNKADQVDIDQSAGNPVVNMQYLELNSPDNKVVITGTGDTSTSVTKVGIIRTSGGTITLKKGGNLQLDTGRIVNTSIILESDATISFEKFSKVTGNVFLGNISFNPKPLVMGGGSIVDTTRTTSNIFSISQDQKLELSNVDSMGNASILTGGVIKTGTLYNKGSLVVTNGKIEGDLVNQTQAPSTSGSFLNNSGFEMVAGEITGNVTNTSGLFEVSGGTIQKSVVANGGEFHITGGVVKGGFTGNNDAIFVFDANYSNATFSGDFVLNGKSRIALITGASTIKTGQIGLTTKDNSLLVALSDKGTTVSKAALDAISKLSTDPKAMDNAIGGINADIGSQVLIDAGSKNISFGDSVLVVNALANIQKGMAVKIIKTTGTISELKNGGLASSLADSLSMSPDFFGKTASFNDVFYVLSDKQNLILVALIDIGKPFGAFPFLSSRTASPFLNLSSPEGAFSSNARHFMTDLEHNISLDANSLKTHLGALTVTTSYNNSINSGFLGMSFKVSDCSYVGGYASYIEKENKINEFGIVTLSKVAGLSFLNGIAYGSHKNSGNLGAQTFDSKNKVMVASSKIARAFETNFVTFTPNVFGGYGQAFDAKHFLGNDMNVKVEGSAGFAGFGVDVLARISSSASVFTNFKASSEIGVRTVTFGQQTVAGSVSTTSLMLGVQAKLGQNSSLYASNETQSKNQQTSNTFEFGMNLKF